MSQESPASPEALPVMYADAALAVVSKPAGLMVHDSALARGETDFAADRLREQFGKPIFLVHRLDRATSGCLLLAFDRDTASALGKALMVHDVQKAAFEKDYWAICRGWPAQSRFTVDHDLDGGPGKPQKKPAVTEFELLAESQGAERHAPEGADGPIVHRVPLRLVPVDARGGGEPGRRARGPGRRGHRGSRW